MNIYTVPNGAAEAGVGGYERLVQMEEVALAELPSGGRNLSLQQQHSD
jgi:hypothetical protein